MIDRVARTWDDPVSRTRLMRWLWLVSTGFTLLGFGIILYLIVVG